MEQNLKELMEATKGMLGPSQIADLRVRLAGEYVFASAQLEEILAKKPEIWTVLRNHHGCTSDTQADRKWEKTVDGVMEMRIKLRLKSIEKVLSALKDRLMVAMEEARMTPTI